MRAIDLLFCLLFTTGAALAQPASLKDRPLLLVLGSGHLANPGRDAVNVHVDDVTAPRRQHEIAVIVNQLAAFHPSHVAVERPADQQTDLDKRYADYRAGHYTLAKGEQEQIGMRLAAKLGLKRVDAVDWNGPPSGNSQDSDFDGWGRAHGFGPRIDAILGAIKRVVPKLGDRSIGAWFLALNRQDTLVAMHRANLDIAQIGADGRQPGAIWTGNWYTRNLRIFNNLTNIKAQPGERVVVIFGAGHAYLLRQFARESGAFRLVDADQVLKAGR